MATTLHLKYRPDEARQVKVDDVLAYLRGPLTDAEKIKGLLEAMEKQPSRTHDKDWLSMIVNWAPQGGHPLTELAKWMQLAVRVSALDDQREGSFTLSDYQTKLIWERMQNADFKIGRGNPALAGFVLDFCQAAGKSFGGDQDTEDISDVPDVELQE